MLDLRPAGPLDPEALLLNAEVQRYYVEIYGEEDHDPVVAAEFAPPAGGFLIGRVDDRPVAMGGWTAMVDRPGDAKLRRMYVRPQGRRLGFATALLDALEEDARRHGMTRMVLTTGAPQVEAVRFYRARGYEDVPAFGFYADSEGAVHLGKALR